MKNNTKEVVVYQGKNGAIELRGDVKSQTIWASQAQIVTLFKVDQSVISRHIRNIFRDREVDQKSNMQKMHIANSDKPVTLYSLDIILAVGYRTNSKVAIEFRQWATKTLRQYVTEGFVINKKVVAKNYASFKKTIVDIQALLPSEVKIDPKSVLDLVSEFAGVWFSLDAYDKDTLRTKGATKKSIKLTATDLMSSISELKTSLQLKNEATDLFATERTKGNLEGIVGNVMQAFGGRDVYVTVEEKAAHLLYFIVKNHPFVDGNKRSGAFAFIWFLRKARSKGMVNINPAALTALTLLIAESDPKQKDKMTALVLQLLSI